MSAYSIDVTSGMMKAIESLMQYPIISAEDRETIENSQKKATFYVREKNDGHIELQIENSVSGDCEDFKHIQIDLSKKTITTKYGARWESPFSAPMRKPCSAHIQQLYNKPADVREMSVAELAQFHILVAALFGAEETGFPGIVIARQAAEWRKNMGLDKTP